ncbi:MAG: UDP-N-acetylmuramoyl-tripeptide--D-alanyl-D-alanine ligase [Lachnospiraceae bacterium]|nr:UDP-N-acetylmuramoyl-tripeptide--D-alanyl-D-alanine ligase [Lachnospiraceae bacterium]
MLIRTLIAAAFFAPAYFYALRHNMHMFQLNGYKNGEHLSWIKKNIRRQWILIFAILLGITRLFVKPLALDVFICFTLYIIFVVYRALNRMSTKKKLVYTPRVKRMLFTIGILSVIGTATIWAVFGWESLVGEMLILVGAQIIFTLLANLINHPVEKAINQYYINDAKKKLQSAKDLTVIGVTGSYGKTSVKFYLQTLLQAKYDVLVTPESYNTPMGVVKTIRGSLKPSHEIFVCEMGARHVGDIKELCDIVHPRHGVITSVGPQHLETFFNMENIKNTKFELADALPAEGLLFLNGDNEFINEKAAQYKDPVFYCSATKGKGYYATDVSVSRRGTEFTVVTPEGEKETFRMKLIGEHNVINVVGAIAVAHRMGITLPELKIPVRKIRPVAHRLEMREHGDVTIIDDAYNSNPVGSKAAVETLKMFDGIRILVTPGMVELGEKEAEYNHKFGTYAADCCDYILLIGAKHTKPILEGVLSAGFDEKKCLVYEHLEDAMSYAYTIRGEGHKYILLENDLPDNY